MDLAKIMSNSEAVEIGLRSCNVVYGRMEGTAEIGGKDWFMIRDSDGVMIMVPASYDNISYIKLVSADPDICRILGDKSENSVQTPGIAQDNEILENIRIDNIKDRYRHNNSFGTASQVKPLFRPRIDKEGK